MRMEQKDIKRRKTRNGSFIKIIEVDDVEPNEKLIRSRSIRRPEFS